MTDGSLSSPAGQGPDATVAIELSSVPEGRISVHPLPSGRNAIVIRNGRDVRVFSEVCPHMGADLAEGILCERGEKLACKWHGYVFSTADGRFLDNPNERLAPLLRKPSEHFRPEKTPRYRLRPIPFTIEGTRLVLGREPAPTTEET
jgi:nitrite reductase/ring-hydroxylating ferredoxin subunit